MNELPEWGYTVLRCYLGLVSATGTFGNSFTLLAIARTPKLRTIPNAYLANLAVVDLIVCAILIPITILSYSGYMEDKPLACRLVGYPNLICLIVAFMSLTGVAMNRYLLICGSKTLYNKLFTTRKVVLSIVLLWTVPMIILTPPLWTDDDRFGSYGFNSQLGVCIFSESRNSYMFLLIMCDCLLFVPCQIANVFCYVNIIREFHKSQKKISQGVTTSSLRESTTGTQHSNGHVERQDSTISTVASRESNKRVMALVKNLAIIWVAFLLCWMPLIISHKVDFHGIFPKLMMHAFFALAQSNSMVNFFIYAIMNQQLRSAYHRMLTCGRQGSESPTPV